MSKIRDLFLKLDSKSRREMAELVGYNPLASAQGDGDAPADFRRALTPNQYRVWLAHQLEGAGIAYTMSCAYRLDGPLDTEALLRTADDLVRRHEALRTSFVEREGAVEMSVAASAKLPFTVTDVAAGADVAARVDEALMRECRRPFDLGQAPLLRMFLYRLAPDRHVLHLLMHHIISDQWSMEVLRRELLTTYTALCERRQPSLRPAPAAPGGEDARANEDDDRSFWLAKLRDAPRYPNLPFDAPPSRTGRWRGRQIRMGEYGRIGEAAAKFAADRGCTLFMVLLAAFALVMTRWTGAREVCIGTRVAGRTRPGSRDAVGFFVNLLALRLQVPRECAVADWLEVVRGETLAAFEHQSLPFEDVLAKLGFERDALLTPLIPVVITHQNIPVAAMAPADGLLVETIVHHNGSAKCELDVAFEGDGSTLSATVEFREDLFGEATIRSLLADHLCALEAMIGDPPRDIVDVERVLDGHRRSASVSGPLVARTGGSFDAKLRDLADRAPDRVFAVDARGSVSVAAIEARSRAIAQSLVERVAVAQLSPVAFLMERSTDWFVAALACLRAGVPYVPLDPDYPTAYTQQVLHTSGAIGLVVDGALADRAASLTGAPSWTLDELAAGAPTLVRLPAIDADSRRPAFMMYTSGSTGTPKGIIYEHRQLNNCVQSFVERHPMADDDVVAQRTSVCFAPSVKEWMMSLSGGSVAVVTRLETSDMRLLDEATARYSLTRMHLVPSHLRRLIAHKAQHAEAFRSLRMVVSAGEPLTTAQARDFLDRFPGVRLLNNYGCSETNDICYFEVTREAITSGDNVPAGTPIPNVTVRIVDANLDAAQVGTVGEVCVVGSCVGMGYLNAPQITAAAFVPAQAEPGHTLLRTGDFGRIRADGVLELAGRRDQQIKVGGARVDIGHVESVLNGHSGVKQAIVLVRCADAVTPVLTAYVTPALDGDAVQALRQYLAGNLPRHMVPAAIVSLEEFPALPNGKVDRMGLPVPQAEAPTASLSPMQEEIAGLWVQIIGQRPQSIDDDFFVLGGDSLQVTELAHALKKAFGVALRLEDLFWASTVAMQAALVEERAGSGE